ncbi:MAG: inositol monophosphatase [Candidatus Aenigmatarchaeota archaeon]
MKYSDELNFAIDTAREAGKRIMKYFGRFESVGTGADNWSATSIEADEASDTYIVSKIKSAYPEYSIFTEESETHGNEYIWRVDPLDGTNNFKRGHHEFSVSMSLEKSGELLLSIVYKPFYDEIFYAQSGEGAWSNRFRNRNPQKLHVSKETSIEEAVISFNAAFFSPEYFDNGSKIIKSFSAFPLIRFRTKESTALDLSDTAAGCFTAHIGIAQSPWDYSAGILLVKEAGGIVTDFAGNPLVPPFSTCNIVASNGLVHDEILKILKNVYK